MEEGDIEISCDKIIRKYCLHHNFSSDEVLTHYR